MPSKQKQSGSESFQSLQNIRNCHVAIQEEVQWLTTQTTSFEVQRYAGEAALELKIAKSKLEKAFAIFEVEQETQEENTQTQQGQQNRPYQARRMAEQNS